jgi:arsenate reductase
LFRENNIDFEKVNYFIEPLGEEKLRDLLNKTGLKPYEVLRKNEAAYKDLKLSKDTPDDDIIRAIARNPSLLQRPIVEVGDRAVVARPAERALELIKNE